MKTFGNNNYLRLVLSGMFGAEHWNVFHMAGPRMPITDLPYEVTFENLSRNAKYVSTTKHEPSASSYEMFGLSSYLLSGSALAAPMDSYDGQGVANPIGSHVVYYPRWISANNLYDRTLLEMLAYKKMGELSWRYHNIGFAPYEFEFDAPIETDVFMFKPISGAPVTYSIEYLDETLNWVSVRTVSNLPNTQAVAADFSAVTASRFRISAVVGGTTQAMEYMYFGKRDYVEQDIVKPDMDFEWCIAAPCTYITSTIQLNHLSTHHWALPFTMASYKVPCLSFDKSDNAAIFDKPSDNPYDRYGGRVRRWRIA